eukprot:4707491-Heterocapsa_arctica.AAC.1
MRDEGTELSWAVEGAPRAQRSLPWSDILSEPILHAEIRSTNQNNQEARKSPAVPADVLPKSRPGRVRLVVLVRVEPRWLT